MAPENTVGGTGAGVGNLISGNTGPGVSLGSPHGTDNVILGNDIGVDVTGNQGLGNDIGVWVSDVANNVIGGTAEGARNVISGNREGVTFWEIGATANRVEGNYIGTNAAGDAAIPNEMGIPVYSPGNVIGGVEAGAGNLISGNDTNGVNFFGENATGNTVLGNLIGTDATGSSALGNGDAGVGIQGGASGNIIGGSDTGARNVLSGNQFGVLIGDQGITGTVIQGNYIGTDISGNAAIPNTQTGILLWGQDNVIGGADAGAGNVISGNNFAGIDLGGGSKGTIIQGNYIGTDASGAVALGNDLGIWFNSSADNLVGGTAAGAGNVISGNTGANIQITGLDARGNTFQGNFIGTDATGTVGLENGRPIQIFDAPDNVIGGAEPGAGNLISGNSPGITIEGPDATGNVFQGNHIGVDATGAAPLGNGGAAIRLLNGASDNLIGGTEPGAGNVIANSGWHGVALFADAGTGNSIRFNSIYDNGGMGIEIGRDAVTPNDEGDVDTGANELQNYPDLTSVGGSGSAAIEASLNSTPSSSFTLEFFSNDACDEQGFGEGKTPLGTASLATDASGFGSVTAAFSGVSGSVITATATDDGGNTSEFSRCSELSTLGISTSPASRTVAPGESATYALTLTAQGGTFQGTVDLGCTGNPGGTTCSFDEDRVTLASGQGSATMTVTTVGPAAVQIPGPPEPPTNPGPMWVGGLILMGLWLARRERNSPLHPLGPGATTPVWGGLRVAAALAWFLLFTACGDEGTRPPSGGTPPGTYQLTVTASWETVQVSTDVTIVVQEP
jgi:titin